MKHTYHWKPLAYDSALVLADNIVQMYNTVFRECVYCRCVCVFPQWRHVGSWNTISRGHREHLTLTETERRNTRRGAGCGFVGEGVGLMYLSRPKFIPSLILL